MEVVEFWFLIPIKKKPKTYGFFIFKIVKIKFETKGKKLANSNTHSRPAKITHLRLFLDFEGSYMCMEIIGLAQRPIIKPLGGDENILLHQHMYIVLLPCEENLWQRFQSPFDGLVCKCKTSSNLNTPPFDGLVYKSKTSLNWTLWQFFSYVSLYGIY